MGTPSPPPPRRTPMRTADFVGRTYRKDLKCRNVMGPRVGA